MTDKEPDVTEPDATKADATEPDAAKPDVAKPDATDPDATKPDVADPDATKPDVADPDATKPDVAEPDKADQPSDKAERRRVTVSVRSLAIAVVVVALVGAVAVFGWLYVGAQRKFDAQTHQLEDNARAEKVALEYAVNAAAMNFQDINAWKTKLVAGTTPELTHKLNNAATSIEQILVPLQWTSTAKPLVAKVRSHTGSIYVVDSFVSVMTKTVQAPDPLQSTATYSVTIDNSKDWIISDVGGVGAAVEDK
jgi:Mce-associated membrane protein